MHPPFSSLDLSTADATAWPQSKIQWLKDENNALLSLISFTAP